VPSEAALQELPAAIPGDVVDDLVLAVREAATTAILHGSCDAPLPSAHRSAYGPDPAAPKAADDGRDRPGVVADHDQDPFQAAGEEDRTAPLDQAQATQPEKGPWSHPGDRFQPLGPARGQHRTHPQQARQRRGGLDHVRPTGERGEQIRR
jgi:hypothetical protein